MPPRFHRPAAVLALALTTAAAIMGGAGPLTPPSGPIAPTHKTLTDVEPRRPISAATTPGDADSVYRITQPGSYYLTGRIVGAAGKSGIEVSASNVTIDLNGFDLVGGQGSLSGIVTPVAGLSNIEVRNGSIAFWGGGGVDLATLPARNCRLEALRCTGNGVGILAGPGATLTGCLATGNAGDGVTTGIIAILIGCKALQNGGDGIDAGAGSTLDACAARQNQGPGFRTGAGTTLTGCSATLNGAAGFSATGATTASDCTAADNTGTGFLVLSGSGAFTSCTAVGNGSSGFITGSGAAFTGCTAAENAEVGINAGSGSVIGCLARSNGGHGISIATGLARGNLCVTNGQSGSGAGIDASNSSRVDDNHCVDNTWGIRVTGLGSVVMRNTARFNNVNYELEGGNNRWGPIVDTRGAAPPVSGDEAAATLESDHPWANFAY